MRLRDPRAPNDADGRPDGYVDVNGTLVAVESDGTFEDEAIDRSWAEGYAERQGASLYDVLIENADTSETEASDADAIERGECPWCDEYDGDHVGQHASSAHPDKWAAYKD